MPMEIQNMGKIFCVEFQSVPLKFHKNILLMHWKMQFSYTVKILVSLRFKNS